MTSEVWAALLGALVAGAIAVGSQIIAGRQLRSAAMNDERAARLADFLAATHAAVLTLGDLAQLPPGDGPGANSESRGSLSMQTQRDRVNSLLNAIELLDSEAVVTAVAELDRSLVRLEDEARGAQWTREAWRARRAEIQGDVVDRVFAAGRTALGRTPIDRPHIWVAADRDALIRVGSAPTGVQRPPYGS